MKTIVTSFLSALCILWVIGCRENMDADTAPTHSASRAAAATYQVVPAFPNIGFRFPVELIPANDGTNRLFVSEQEGWIRVFNNTPDVTSTGIFLDLTDRVWHGGEGGILGLAFHPNYRQNGYFYVYYTIDNPIRSVFSRFRVNPSNPNQADKATEQILLIVDQPFGNHKGGSMHFGPDRLLYIALGDGGSGGDPMNNAQNLTNLLGKILRIDVDKTDKGNYGIPSTNPFRGNRQGYKEEIYAYGLRNPWKMTFDRNTLWVGDVGQGEREEIDIISRGGNYGWRIKEGKTCYGAATCNGAGLIDPVWDYPRTEGKSITGGYVYRGKTFPGLVGKYIYGDFISGNIWALTISRESGIFNELLVAGAGNITTFGEDIREELYFCTYNDGKIWKLAAQ